MCNSRHQNKAETCSDPSPSPTTRNIRKLIPGLCHPFYKLLEALICTLPAQKELWKKSKKNRPLKPISASRQVSLMPIPIFFVSEGLKGAPWLPLPWWELYRGD